MPYLASQSTKDSQQDLHFHFKLNTGFAAALKENLDGAILPNALLQYVDDLMICCK